MLREAVVSSNVAEIGHEGDVLEVRYKSGGTYRYVGVDAERAAEIRASESIGRAINALKGDPSIRCEKATEVEATL